MTDPAADTPASQATSKPTLSPALTEARKQVDRATVAYVVFGFIFGLFGLLFLIDPLRAEFGRVPAALILVTIVALPGIPIGYFGWCNDRAVKRELAQ